MTAMAIPGPVPEWLLSAVAALTLFAVMFDLGLIIVPGEFRWVAERPSLMAKALFAVVVAVPAIAWAVARVMDLPRAAEIGIMLMAIAPGAPVALRNALVAGGHRAFAPALQISLAIVAIASMPLFVAAFDEYYAGEASVDPRHLARQVFFAQLLPLALGVATMRLWPAAAGRVEPALRKAATLLLVLLAVLALAGVWEIVIGAGWRVIAAIVTDPVPRPRTKRDDIPQELEDVIMRALAKDPRDRFPDVRALSMALAPFAPETELVPLTPSARVRLAHSVPPKSDAPVAASPCFSFLSRSPPRSASVSRWTRPRATWWSTSAAARRRSRSSR